MLFEDLNVERVTGEPAGELLKLLPNNVRGFVKIGKKKWFMPYKYAEKGEKIYNFETRPDDTWIVTYPRSGTTVTQELIWLVANDLNFDEAHRRSLFDRFPFVDLSIIRDGHVFADYSPNDHAMIQQCVERARDLPSPRFIKSHLPLDLLPTVVNNTCKVCLNRIFSIKGTFEQFCNYFMTNHICYCPFWEHVKEGWAMKHRPNTLFLFYEDLIKDLPGNIRKLAEFFGKTYSDEQIAKLAEHVNIDNFRKNPMINQAAPGSPLKPEDFIRQGKTGGWAEVFTPELEKRFDKWIADNLKDTDLRFPS
ncbi:Sulfotransferase 1C4 [Ooceraea biroi]|uniref:Sulfotransferase 1C4 n=1 Tax=Ooceraea biroi TaxID=2015173 RepID=A0A026WGH5_OOCBI|nr:Sulfotransferase 1C4 [Ooceraea biroi]